MIKLYYKPLACSLAVHIAAREIGIPVELVQVKAQGTARTAGGADYLTVHPLGVVPALMLEDGTVLTETAVILQFLAKYAGNAALAPQPGDPEYWKFLQLMNFIATDVHKNFGPMFYPGTPAEMKQVWEQRLDRRLSYLAETLERRSFLLRRGYSVADIYLFVMLFWCSYVDVDIARWPALSLYFDTLSDRRAIKEALDIEKAGG